MPKYPKQARGFTVIELMITIAVASILLSLAVPAFTTSIQNNRSVTQINELHAALSFARSEAIKRNTNITLCVSNNGTDCHADLDLWHHGWIVFSDSNFNGAVDVVDEDEILRVHGPQGFQNTLTFSQKRIITYASSGLTRSAANDTFTLCDNRGAAHAKGLIIGPSGRPRLATDSDLNGIVEDAGSVDLVCS